MNKKDNWGLPEPIISKGKSKNGKYVAMFYYWKEDGTKGHSNTRSFSTKKKAINYAKAKQEEWAKKMQEHPTDLSKKTILQCLNDYENDLNDKLNIRTTEKASRFKDTLDDVKSIRKNHAPASILNKRLYELEDDEFFEWIKHIDQKDIKNRLNGLSGSRVWSYRKTLGKFLDFLSKKEYFAFDKKLGSALKNNLYEYKLKKKESGKREDVYVPTYLDMNVLGYSIKRDNFLGDYDYVLFKVLFYSGIRICEIIALRWCDVDFDRGLIHIFNSINQKEKRANVMYRISKGVGRTKNKGSQRYIPIMEVYYKLFKNYKHNYQMHFKLDENEMWDCFCFPKLQSKEKEGKDKGPRVYQTQKWIQQELARRCDDSGVDKFPPESLRHGCARFIANDLRILESEAYDLFGHTDNKMLKEVYANLSAEEKAVRIAKRQPGLFYRDEEYERKLKEKQKKRAERFKKGEKLDSDFFQDQFHALRDKIEHLIDEGQTYYMYTELEEPVVDRLIKQFHYDDYMTFLKEEK